MPISIIVSTYNRPDMLKLVLTALNEQSEKNFEVVIADDGSSEKTAEMIENLKNSLNKLYSILDPVPSTDKEITLDPLILYIVPLSSVTLMSESN